MSKLKILFATADHISLKTLEAIHASDSENFSLVAVLGSKNPNSKNSIAEFCKANGITYLNPPTLKEEERKTIASLGCNFLLSFSISRIFGPKFLALFTEGSANIHPSRLPKYRGPSPLQYSILNGDNSSSISLQRISLAMDEGEIFRTIDFNLAPRETIATLRDKVSTLSATNVVSFLDDYAEGRLNPTAQAGEASYTKLFTKDDGMLELSSEGVVSLDRKIRALNPWPGVWCSVNNERLCLIETEVIADETDYNLNFPSAPIGSFVCYDKKEKGLILKLKDGYLSIKKLKKEGRKELSAFDFYNGNKRICYTT